MYRTLVEFLISGVSSPELDDDDDDDGGLSVFSMERFSVEEEEDELSPAAAVSSWRF
jgi:hypothetical protein